MAAVQQQTTQLEFHQAMTDFKTMFPDMDDDVIEAVLRANQGAVDTTIDQLLAMSTDNENEKLRKEIENEESGGVEVKKKDSTCTSPKMSPPSLLTRIPVSQPCSSPHKKSPPSVFAGEKSKWHPPLLGPLPKDFLRVSSAQWKTNSSAGRENVVLSHQFLQQKYVENKQKRGALADLNDPDLARYLEDERIALFLQNEEFMQELRRNKDFMTSLEKDLRSRQRRKRPDYWSSSDEDSDSSSEQAETLESPPEEVLGAFGYGKAIQHDDDALFKEKLKNMGKMSRKKFAQLARVFTGRKKRSAKQILSQGPAPSKDNLLLSAEPILVDDDSEEANGEDEQEKETTMVQACNQSSSVTFSHQGSRPGFSKLEGQ